MLQQHTRSTSQSASELRPAPRRNLYPRFVTKDIPCSCLVSMTSNGRHTCLDVGSGKIKAENMKPTIKFRSISENSARYSGQTNSCTSNLSNQPDPRIAKTGQPGHLTQSLPSFIAEHQVLEHPLGVRHTRGPNTSSRSIPGTTKKPERTSLSYTNGVLDPHQHGVDTSGSIRRSSSSGMKRKQMLYPRFATTVMMPTASAHCEKLFESLTSAGYPTPQSEPKHDKKPCTSIVSCQNARSKAVRWTSALCIKQLRETFKTAMMSCNRMVVKTFDSGESAQEVDTNTC